MADGAQMMIETIANGAFRAVMLTLIPFELQVCL